jgi:hypothetical protein
VLTDGLIYLKAYKEKDPMKSFRSLCLAVLLAAAPVGVSFLPAPIATGQSPFRGKADYPIPDGQSKAKTKADYSAGSIYLRGSTDGRLYTLQNQSMQLAQQMAKAENDDDKRELRKKLTQVLEQLFDAHLKEQQKDLDDLEKQVARLKKLLSKRREAKEAIVERRLEQLVQEAEGLGWNAPNAPRGIPYLGGANVPLMEMLKK